MLGLGAAPKWSLRKSLEYINSNPLRPTNSFAIVNFNNIIEKGAKGRTLTDIIESVRVNNLNLRSFIFPLMQQIIVEKNQQSNL